MGLILGSAFTSVVNSVVNDLFTPILGLAVDSSLENAHVVIACPKRSNNSRDRGVVGVDCDWNQWPTVSAAKTAGAITWNYGSFIQISINFLIISLIVYFIVKVYSTAFRIKKPKKGPNCKYCYKEVHSKATKCCWCCSEIEPKSPDIAKSSTNSIVPSPVSPAPSTKVKP